MDFNSYIFILEFLPLLVIAYFLIGKLSKPSLSKGLLMLASILFILYADWRFLLFFAVSIAVNFLGALLVSKNQTAKSSKIILSIIVIANVVVLGYFKYTLFAIETLSSILSKEFTFHNIIVPLGISFFTFQQISYVVDVYRGKAEVCLIDYLVYALYFPKLVQGPITRYDYFVEQFKAEDIYRVNSDNLADGLYMFIGGLARKVLLADIFAKGVSFVWNDVYSATSLELFLGSICFTLQIYFDFGGYSRMAMGVSKMFNLNLPDNFDRPYLATSIDDFWKRWHISLTDFLRDYVYFPLGGSRKGKIRTYINILVVFLVSGIWHGSNWTFIVWGLLHGVAQCIHRAISSVWDKIYKWIKVILTFLFVNFAWIFFRSPSIESAWTIIKRIFSFEGSGVSTDFMECFHIPEFQIFTSRYEGFANFMSTIPAYGLIGYLIASFVLIFFIQDRMTKNFKPSVIKCIISVLLLFASIISLSTVVEFIYGGF